MGKIIKIITILLMCLGIQLSGIMLCISVLEDKTFTYAFAIFSFIILTSLIINKALEEEKDENS